MKKLLALFLALLMLVPMLVACKPQNDPDEPDPGEDVTPGGEDPSNDPSDPTVDPSDLPPSGTQDGLYVPSAQKQRETYELVTAYGYEDGPYLVETVYVTEQVVVADIIVTPEAYGVDPTGVEDSTAGIQKALDDCYAMGGGTVFLPVGQYVVTDTVRVPYGVVLQGDWQDPDLTDKPEYGTVILAKIEALLEEEYYDPSAKPLFELLAEGDGNNGLIGLTFYYPDQDINDVKPYGYTVYGGRPRMVMLRDLTFINSYQGIGACLNNEGTHELLQVENVRMTVLSMGYKASLSREIGYTVDLRISPKYWRDAAGSFACSDADALRDYCREYAIGMEFYALDLNQYTDIMIEGCHTAMLSRDGFWGVFYDVDIKDCVYGFVAESLNGSSGVLIAKATIEADVYAVANYARNLGALKLADVKTTGKGGIHTAEGANTVIDNDDDLTKYDPEYATYIRPNAVLYVADVADVEGKKEDAAPAIQLALDAAAATGGIVYVPHGVYSLYTPLKVPTGVELRGAMSMAVRDKEASGGLIPGTVFLTYVNEGDFITLAAKSGIQGIRIFYPSYDATTALELIEAGDDVINTSVAVRGTGEYVYAMNMVISGAMIGIDFTGCDNHAVKQTFGCAFNNFIRAGGTGGIIEAVLCNMTFTMRQPFYVRNYYDTAYVNLANCEFHREGNSNGFATIRDKVLRTYNDVVYAIDAQDLTLNNVFMYGCHSILRTDNSQVVGYNVTSDWQGICPMFKIENGSDVVLFNPLRTSGKSHEADADCSLTIYNRNVNGSFLEPTYRSESGHADNAGGEAIDSVMILDCDTTEGTKGVTLNTDPRYVKQGEASLKWKEAESQSVLLEARFPAVDASELGTENLFLHVSIWVEDPNYFVWTSNKLTVSNSKSGKTFGWPTTSALSGAGWNEVWLPLDSCTGDFDEQDLNGIDTINIAVTNSPITPYPDLYIDDIYIAQMLPYTDVAFQETEELEPYERPMFEIEVEPARIMLNNCDTLDYLSEGVLAYATLNTDPTYVKEGNGSVKVQTNRQVFFEMLFPATDAGKYANYGFLHMWLYIDDASGGGQIELTSSGTYDSGEKSWSVSVNVPKSGWNELWLPIHGGSPSGTVVFDAESIRYMRMYLNNGGAGKPIYIDDIYICNVTDPTVYNESNTGKVGTALAVQEDLPILHRCDSDKGLKGMTVVTTPEFVKEGKASLMSKNGQTERFVYVFNALDITEYMDGYLHFWMYIENPENLRSGYIEMTSSGRCDAEEICWRVKDVAKVSGWNEILLPLSNPYSGGDFASYRFNYLRIYTQWESGAKDCDVYFDDFRLIDGDGTTPVQPSTPAEPTPSTPAEPTPATPAVDESGKLMLLDGEEKVAGLASYISVSDKQVKVGKGALYSNAGLDRIRYDFAPIDVSAYKDGYLHMWVYVANYADIDRGYIELTSGGNHDTQEICWPAMNYIKQEGWNELWLPLNKAVKGSIDETVIDLTRVNFMRVFLHPKEGKGATEVYFDDIYFVNTNGGSQTPSTPTTPTQPTVKPTVDESGKLILLDGESVPEGFKSASAVVSDAQVKQGKTSLMTKQAEVRFEYNFAATDISAYKDGYLHMWVYVTDFDNINRGFIELTSSGIYDKNEISWPVLDHIKQNGWNEIFLPLNNYRGGDLDWTGVNYIRMYTIHNDTTKPAAEMFFDDIYFVNAK